MLFAPSHLDRTVSLSSGGDRPLVIGLVNNMPDPALKSTERQFRELLGEASGPQPIALRQFSLPDVPRMDSGRGYIREHCDDFEKLWDAEVDGLIVTGTQPVAADLTEEPYWPILTELMERAVEHRTAVIWSCLAAHAAVRYLDGIDRRALPVKLSGVYECAKAANSPLLGDHPACWTTPHSRYYEVPEEALAPHGYQVLARSALAGADLFTKRLGCLFLFVQGHPEYDACALLREYRRDVRRYLVEESPHYPELPHGYLGERARRALLDFRAEALSKRNPELMPRFPMAFARQDLQDGWHQGAVRLYRNWLDGLRGERSRRRIVGHPCEGVPGVSGPALPLASGTTPVVRELFPQRVERQHWDDLLTRSLHDAEAEVAAGAVTPTLDMDRFRREISAFDFRAPRQMEALFSWVIAQLEQGVVHITHPRYFGLFNPAPTFPAQCADRIAAAFNPQLATLTTSPVAVEIEAHVIGAVVRRAGLATGATGHFTSGGAEANYTALICALTRAHPKFAACGARALPGAPSLYVSRESHLAWFKIAHQAGIGRDSVRLIATDGTGRMDPAALAEAIARDRADGRTPVMVGATAGTTAAGMIDPLDDCAATAREHRLWYHVDAAWGGAAIASERMRGVLDGIEQADSVTIDAHKWLATTMGCGMFLTRDPASLSAAFDVATSYMPSGIRGVDPYVTSVQWSRRFLGLRLFMSLAAAGWTGYARHVEHALDLAAVLREALGARGWKVVNRSPLAVVCLEPPPASAGVRTIVRRVLESGKAWVSATEFEGRQVVRACVTHGETTQADAMALVEALEGARLPREGAAP